MTKEDLEYIKMAINEMLGGHYNLYKSNFGEQSNPEDDIVRKQLKEALEKIEKIVEE